MSPLIAAIIGISLILLSTLAGSLSVLIIKKPLSPNLKAVLFGFGSGILLSSAIFGLLNEAINTFSEQYIGAWIALPLGIGFTLGAGAIFVFDIVFTKISQERLKNHSVGGLKMLAAAAFHNIPECLSVGFVFGAAFDLDTEKVLMTAFDLTLALIIHNIIQGITVSWTINELGTSKKNSFLSMVLIAIVEAIFAIIGVFIADSMSFLMPWLLAFASGAMIYVVIDDLMPNTREENGQGIHAYAVVSFFFGFVLMMLFELIF